MKSSRTFVVSILLSFGMLRSTGQMHGTLKFAEVYACPGVPPGHLDHMTVEGFRLFVTPEAADEVLIFDLRDGKVLHTIRNINTPHAVVYMPDANEFYVTYQGLSGAPGGLKVFNGKTYALIKDVKVFPHADASAYDASTHRIFVDDGGGPPTLSYGQVSVIDSRQLRVVATYRIPGAHFKRMAIGPQTAKLYINDVAGNQVDVIAAATGMLLAQWRVTSAKLNIPMALDERQHRLFIGCRSGSIVVLDTRTGRELQSLSIAKGIDDLIYDPETGRLYASCGAGRGEIDVYQERQGGAGYRLLERMPSAAGAKTAILSHRFKKYFVAAPAHDRAQARILAYDVQ